MQEQQLTSHNLTMEIACFFGGMVKIKYGNFFKKQFFWCRDHRRQLLKTGEIGGAKTIIVNAASNCSNKLAIYSCQQE